MSYPGIAGPELGDKPFVHGTRAQHHHAVAGWDPGGDPVQERLQELLAAPLQAVVRDATAAGPHPRIVADVACRAVA